jgi:hypothetical protein
MSLLCQDLYLDSLRTPIPYSNFQTSMYRSVGIYTREFSRLPTSCQLVLRPCIPNALITIGMTNGVLSFVGDLIILSLPIPMIWALQINLRRKIALNAIFLIGGFVCLTSIFRFVALAHINVKDLTCKFAYLAFCSLLGFKGIC